MKDEKGKIGKECLIKSRRKKKKGLSVTFKRELSNKESTDEEVTERTNEVDFQKEDGTLDFQDSDLRRNMIDWKKQLFRKKFELTDLQQNIESFLKEGKMRQIQNQQQQIVALKKELSKKEYDYKWLSDATNGRIREI